MERLSHKHFSFELRMHGEERSTVEVLESAYEDDLDVFDV